MTRKIAKCKLSNGLLSAQTICFRHALLQKFIGELSPTPWSAANQSVQLCPDNDVSQTLNVGLDAFIHQYRLKLLPGEICVTLQCLDDCGIAFGKQFIIELEFPIVMHKELFHSRCRQLKHPAYVLWHDEMPSGTQHMGA
ncbi:Uncharacterised protein [uncultured archaeon]|nr:Uncharacterised protein [uncultured archaeon]